MRLITAHLMLSDDFIESVSNVVLLCCPKAHQFVDTRVPPPLVTYIPLVTPLALLTYYSQWVLPKRKAASYVLSSAVLRRLGMPQH